LTRPLAGHRIVSVVPIVLLAIATLIGGWVNTVDMHAQLVDDYTSEGAQGGSVTFGTSRSAPVDGSTGAFTFPSLPRTSQVSAIAPGYLKRAASTTDTEIRLSPLSFTIQVNEAGANPVKWIAKAEIRQGDKLLATTNDGGNVVISPHPGKDAKLLICAAGYDQKEIIAHGVIGTFEVTPGTNACPPLPTPSPSPSPSPSASPGTPSPAPSPSPTSSP
jgi:hypothetical protein